MSTKMNRPNILFIMSDQHRADCTSIEGRHPVLTPNMDSIAAAGARFTKAYTTCPSCIASRRSLLSGQFPPTHGMVGYRDGVEWDAPPTLPGVLSDEGYQTGIVGRDMHQHPIRKRYGYQEMVINDRISEQCYDKWLVRNANVPNADWFGGGVMHNDWTAKPWHLEESLHFSNWVTDQALDYLKRRDPSCPFFLTVSYIAPHPPLQPPACYIERYLRTGVLPPDIGDWATPPEGSMRWGNISSKNVKLEDEVLLSARAGYYGLINHVDDQIRRLINPVNGIDSMTGGNTIVVYTSDHGEMLGDHYRWHKIAPYEGSARIPLFLRAPQRFGIKPETVSNEAVCLEDIMPTLLDLAGAAIPDTVEGRSLVPLMRGETPEWRNHLHIEHAPDHQSLTNGKEKFIWLVKDGTEQYFDLDSDPTELKNLIDDPGHQDRIAEWRNRLIEELHDRPEGFVEEGKLVPGRPYAATLPHAGKV